MVIGRSVPITTFCIPAERWASRGVCARVFEGSVGERNGSEAHGQAEVKNTLHALQTGRHFVVIRIGLGLSSLETDEALGSVW